MRKMEQVNGLKVRERESDGSGTGGFKSVVRDLVVGRVGASGADATKLFDVLLPSV